MIISASYKTDIPTFYGEWFMLEGELQDYVASLTDSPQHHP